MLYTLNIYVYVIYAISGHQLIYALRILNWPTKRRLTTTISCYETQKNGETIEVLKHENSQPKRE